MRRFLFHIITCVFPFWEISGKNATDIKEQKWWNATKKTFAFRSLFSIAVS
jgi:hypothetical protein